MNTKRIKWFFFDVGETLVDESEPIRDIIGQFVEQASLLGWPLRHEEALDAFMEAHRSFSPFPMQDVMKKFIKSDADIAAVRSAMKYRKELEKPFPQAKELLRKLAQNYRIGIIANQSAGTTSRLERYGMLEHIHAVFSSSEEGLAKPDPRFFELALSKTACLPEEAVMVGDRIDNDIIPAKKLGMRAIWVRQGLARLQAVPGNPLFAPDWTVERLADMESLADFNKSD
ncbi:HAD family hydrolase [Paenibacillus beijingensis]|uniref:Haloacid dehalogenase n=1 Tax=Paenibacillus beijingensis TaxID=1126833 RepID=A0A0D5NG62_9BACL|nr:HAD family hydrolase [Paenibacillus beijingensis]AJY73908.1 hypothetical protein VN24_03880 [Paenibacillus beijingensis]